MYVRLHSTLLSSIPSFSTPAVDERTRGFLPLFSCALRRCCCPCCYGFSEITFVARHELFHVYEIGADCHYCLWMYVCGDCCCRCVAVAWCTVQHRFIEGYTTRNVGKTEGLSLCDVGDYCYLCTAVNTCHEYRSNPKRTSTTLTFLTLLLEPRSAQPQPGRFPSWLYPQLLLRPWYAALRVELFPVSILGGRCAYIRMLREEGKLNENESRWGDHRLPQN